MNKRTRIGVGIAAVFSIGLLAGVGLADQWVSPQQAQVPSMQVEAQPSEVTLACSPGIVDPITSQPVSGTERWSSISGQWEDPTAVQQLDTGEGLSIPSAVSLSVQGGGELRSLVASGCQMPVEDQWVAAGSTTTGNDVVLILANPSTKPTVAHLSALGPVGPLSEGSPAALSTGQSGQSGSSDSYSNAQELQQFSVDVPAGQVVSVLPASWWPDQDTFAIHIQADGPPLAAWVQSSGMIGEVPVGLSQTSGTVPATDHVLAGTTSGIDGSVLRLVVPGSEDATVSVQVQNPGEQWKGLAGAEEVTVAAGTVLDVSIQGLDQGPVVRVQSDQPVVAQAMMVHTGAPWPDSDQQWLSRSALSPSWQVTHVVLPGADQLQAVVAEQANQKPERATSVTTDSGLAGPLTPSDSADDNTTPQSGSQQSTQLAQSGGNSDSTTAVVTASLLVTNTSQREATVNVANNATTLAAGASAIMNVPAQAATLTSNVPINAAVIIQAELKTGPVRAVWPLGSVGVSSQTMDIRVNR